MSVAAKARRQMPFARVRIAKAGVAHVPVAEVAMMKMMPEAIMQLEVPETVPVEITKMIAKKCVVGRSAECAMGARSAGGRVIAGEGQNEHGRRNGSNCSRQSYSARGHSTIIGLYRGKFDRPSNQKAEIVKRPTGRKNRLWRRVPIRIACRKPGRRGARRSRKSGGTRCRTSRPSTDRACGCEIRKR